MRQVQGQTGHGYRDYVRSVSINIGGPLPVRALATIVIGMVVLAVVGLTSRLSGLGPLLAGLVFGGVPAVLALFAPGRLFGLVRDLPQPYDQAGNGLVLAAAVLFPVLTALLVGAGLGGRWVRR